MARKKVRVAWIASDRSRRAMYQKRSEGLFKKAMELCAVCGVEAAIAVFCPDEEPAFWPSKPSVVELYKRYVGIPAMERSKKMLNQDNFMKDRIAKTEEQIKKCLKRSRETEINDLIYQIVSQNRLCELPISDLTKVMEFLKEKNREVRRRATHLQGLPPLFGNGTNPPSSSLSSLPSGPISISTPNGSAPSEGLDTEGADKCIVDKTMINHIAGSSSWDEIGMPNGNSEMEFPQGNTHTIPTAQKFLWLPFRNIHCSATGIQMESLIGSTDFQINIVTSSDANQMQLPHRDSDLVSGSEMNLPYERGSGRIYPPEAANQMGVSNGFNSSWITDLLMAGNDMLGLRCGINDSFADGNEMGVPHGNCSTSVTVANEAGLLTGNSTSGHQMGDEMGQLRSYAEVGPGADSNGGVKIMGLPQENVANSSGGNNGGQQYDDVNYDAWFESLGV